MYLLDARSDGAVQTLRARLEEQGNSVVIVGEDAREVTGSVPFLLSAAIIVWLVFGYPRVEVSDGGITLVNVIRTTHIPWPCFAGADSRWNLRVDTQSGSYTAWALPAGSGTARRLPGRKGEPSMTQRQLSGNTAEAAAAIIGERFAALKDAGHLSVSPIGDVEVARTVNRSALIGGAVIALLMAVALL